MIIFMKKMNTKKTGRPMGYVHKNKLLTSMKFADDFSLSESATGIGYRYLRKYYADDKSTDLRRVFIGFNHVDNILTSYKRISDNGRGKIQSTWFKLEIDEAGNMVTYEDSDGNFWREEWGVEFIFEALLKKGHISYRRFSKWHESRIKMLLKYSS
jgi:hypothetical protein